MQAAAGPDAVTAAYLCRERQGYRAQLAKGPGRELEEQLADITQPGNPHLRYRYDHRCRVTQTTKHRSQVQLDQTKSEEKSSGKRHRDYGRTLHTSSQSAPTTARSCRNYAAQQQRRDSWGKKRGRIRPCAFGLEKVRQ